MNTTNCVYHDHGHCDHQRWWLIIFIYYNNIVIMGNHRLCRCPLWRPLPRGLFWSGLLPGHPQNQNCCHDMHHHHHHHHWRKNIRNTNNICQITPFTSPTTCSHPTWVSQAISQKPFPFLIVPQQLAMTILMIMMIMTVMMTIIIMMMTRLAGVRPRTTCATPPLAAFANQGFKVAM